MLLGNFNKSLPTTDKQLIKTHKKKSVRMKERKIRDNNQLRKLVTPTNARDAIKKLNDKTQDVNISNIIKPTKVMTAGGASIICCGGHGKQCNIVQGHRTDQERVNEGFI